MNGQHNKKEGILFRHLLYFPLHPSHPPVHQPLRVKSAITVTAVQSYPCSPRNTPLRAHIPVA